MNGKVNPIMILIGVGIGGLAAVLGLGTAPTNHLGWVLFFIGAGCCMAGSLSLAIARYREFFQVQAGDRSYWIIALALLVIALAPPVEFLYLSAILPRAHLMQEAGLILFGSGLVLYLWSRSLLEWWDTGEIQIKTNPPLTREGAFQVIRYPAYLGWGLLAVGICVGYSSLIGLLAVLGLLIPGIVYRIKTQNKWLALQNQVS